MGAPPMLRLVTALRCWFGGHGDTYRATVDGVRVFRCVACGRDVPQITRERPMPSPPASDTMKARPTYAPQKIRRMK